MSIGPKNPFDPFKQFMTMKDTRMRLGLGLQSIGKNLGACLLARAMAANGVQAETILTQNFDGTPPNYTLTGAQTAGTSYFALSNAGGITLNPNLNNGTGGLFHHAGSRYESVSIDVRSCFYRRLCGFGPFHCFGGWNSSGE